MRRVGHAPPRRVASDVLLSFFPRQLFAAFLPIVAEQSHAKLAGRGVAGG